MKLMKLSFLLIATWAMTACGGQASIELGTTPEKPPFSQIKTEQFIAQANQASCSNLRNRLFVINQKYVLWDKAGTCADASYSQTLYSTTPQQILCSNMDSIAGPRLSCTDSSMSDLFTSIIKNIDKNNFGLSFPNTVQALAETNQSFSSIFFYALNSSFYRGPAPLNIVIKDQSSWTNFWKTGNMTPPTNYLPTSNTDTFFDSMVLGTFSKSMNDCSINQILKLVSNGSKITVDYFNEERLSVTRCDPNSLPSTPMSLISALKIDSPIEFKDISQFRVAHKLIQKDQFSGISNKKNIVIKDQAIWASLWSELKNNSNTIPHVDFTKNMLIGVFLGDQSCIEIDRINLWVSNGKLNVAHHDIYPGPATSCITAILNPYIIIETPLTNLPVEFNAIPIIR